MINTTVTHQVSISYESDEPLCDSDREAITRALQLALDRHQDELGPQYLTIAAYAVEVKALP